MYTYILLKFTPLKEFIETFVLMLIHTRIKLDTLEKCVITDFYLE